MLGNGREVDAPRRGGGYLVVGARRRCRSGGRRFVSKSWSLLQRAGEGARGQGCAGERGSGVQGSAGVLLLAAPAGPRSPRLRCSNPRTRIGGSRSGSGEAPAEWGCGGRNSFLSSSSSRWWCSRDSPFARRGVRACLPLGAHSKSERLPGLPEQVVQGCWGVGKGAYEGCKEWVGHAREGQRERGCMQAAAAARARGVSGSWEGRR